MDGIDLISSHTVAVSRLDEATYPGAPPFHPSEPYPEYRGELSREPNLVYGGVRQALRLLGLDGDRYGTAVWNPFAEFIKPGDRVALKPNFLAQGHALKPDEWLQIITHGSIIRAVLDYVIAALEGKGEILVIDGPQYDSDWDMIIERTGTRKVIDFCARQGAMPIKLIDLREYQQEVVGDVICSRKPLASDPLGGVEIDLGNMSMFIGHGGAGHYFGSDYNQQETNWHHSDGRHEYRISRSTASADVFINLPKLKTHKKVGVTLSLKNLVGINVGRNWLPHHTDSSSACGGDQFPVDSIKTKSERIMVRWLQRQVLRFPMMLTLYRTCKFFGKRIFGRNDQAVRHGNWHGNDTAWRMVLDINRCFLYADGRSFPATKPRRYFSLVDGVVGGDGDGPASADSYPAGIIMGGFNPLAVDCVAARLMGFDPMRIALLRCAFGHHPLPLVNFSYEAINIVSNFSDWQGTLKEIDSESTLHFKPHFGWVGQIEFGRR